MHPAPGSEGSMHDEMPVANEDDKGRWINFTTIVRAITSINYTLHMDPLQSEEVSKSTPSIT